MINITIIKERRKVLNKKLFKKEAFYLNAISFNIFDNVILNLLKKRSLKKSTQNKPIIVFIKSNLNIILTLLFNFTSILITVSFIIKDLKVITFKSFIIILKSFILY